MDEGTVLYLEESTACLCHPSYRQQHPSDVFGYRYHRITEKPFQQKCFTNGKHISSFKVLKIIMADPSLCFP